MKKIVVLTCLAVMVLLMAITIGGGCYMLDYSLAPDPTRANTDSCYRQLFTDYPETKEWMDSLRMHHALGDTTMIIACMYTISIRVASARLWWSTVGAIRPLSFSI